MIDCYAVTAFLWALCFWTREGAALVSQGASLLKFCVFVSPPRPAALGPPLKGGFDTPRREMRLVYAHARPAAHPWIERCSALTVAIYTAVYMWGLDHYSGIKALAKLAIYWPDALMIDREGKGLCTACLRI
jgi:hypothetical protein